MQLFPRLRSVVAAAALSGLAPTAGGPGTVCPLVPGVPGSDPGTRIVARQLPSALVAITAEGVS